MSDQSFSLEKAIKDLETIVNKMESETLPLEQALSYFEQGVTLTKRCQQALQQAEQKIETITNQLQTDGNLPEHDDQ